MKESKKEALIKFHRDNIIDGAEKLFFKNGVENTSMDDIARESGYSKATLYVYFKNKDEIVSSITLLGMKIFLNIVRECVNQKADFKSQYFALCYALVDFQNKHPFYYENILSDINVDIELEETPKIYHEIYDIGVMINNEVLEMFQNGVAQGAIRDDLILPQVSLIYWASISGIIGVSNKKDKYITKCLDIAQKNFIKYGFELLYQSIQVL